MKIRRCEWCGVELRWWQVYNCRLCQYYLRYERSEPPCKKDERTNDKPDRLFVR